MLSLLGSEPVEDLVIEGDEALSDFQFYAKNEKDQFDKRGIRFYEIYARSFVLKTGDRTSIIQSTQFEHGVGYYLIAPGKKPQILQDVMTDSDLLEVTDKYFSTPAK